MRMYVKVMAAVIACILLSGEAYSALATTPATENLSWFKKKKKKNSEEERVKSDYEKLVEGSSVKKGMFAVYQKKNDYYFEVPTSLLGRDLLVVNKLQRVPAELNDAGVNRVYQSDILLIRGHIARHVARPGHPPPVWFSFLA